MSEQTILICILSAIILSLVSAWIIHRVEGFFRRKRSAREDFEKALVAAIKESQMEISRILAKELCRPANNAGELELIEIQRKSLDNQTRLIVATNVLISEIAGMARAQQALTDAIFGKQTANPRADEPGDTPEIERKAAQYIRRYDYPKEEALRLAREELKYDVRGGGMVAEA